MLSKLYKTLYMQEEVSSFDLILLDVKNMLGTFTNVTISHVNRTAIRVVLALAREAYSMSIGQEVWLGTFINTMQKMNILNFYGEVCLIKPSNTMQNH